MSTSEPEGFLEFIANSSGERSFAIAIAPSGFGDVIDASQKHLPLGGLSGLDGQDTISQDSDEFLVLVVNGFLSLYDF